MSEVEMKLWARVERYIPLLNFVPFLRFVGVCNSLSFGITDANSDIDLFIVAKKGRLFFVRTVVTLFFQLLGVRRHGNKVAGRFCLCFFIDDTHLSMKTISFEGDIYLAFWVRKMIPIFDDGVFKSFFASNTWIRSYFDDLIVSSSSRNFRKTSFVRHFVTIIFNGNFGNWLEKILMNWQLRRSKKKMLSVGDSSGLIVEKNILKFHNIDRRRVYHRAWFDRFDDQIITSEKFLEIARFR